MSHALISQLSFYLSDRNLVEDDFTWATLVMNGHELPLLLVATYKRVEQALRAIDCWASLADRLEQLQLAVREADGVELCGTNLSSMRRTSPPPADAFTHARVGVAEAGTAVTALLLPADGGGVPRPLLLPRRRDYLAVCTSLLGADTISHAPLVLKGRESVGPRLLAPFDVPPRLARPAPPTGPRAKDKPWAALTPEERAAAAAIGYDEAAWEAGADTDAGTRRWAELAAAERAAAATLGYDERAWDAELVDADDAPLTSELIDTAEVSPPPEPEPADPRPPRAPNAVASALAGVALCGDAILIDANVRHGNLVLRDVRLAELEGFLAERNGPLGLAAKMQGRPCVGGWRLPRIGAWTVATAPPKSVLTTLLQKRGLPGAQYTTRMLKEGAQKGWHQACINVAVACFGDWNVPEGARALSASHYEWEVAPQRLKRDAEGGAALVVLDELARRAPSAAPPLEFGGWAAPPARREADGTGAPAASGDGDGGDGDGDGHLPEGSEVVFSYSLALDGGEAAEDAAAVAAAVAAVGPPPAAEDDGATGPTQPDDEAAAAAVEAAAAAAAAAPSGVAASLVLEEAEGVKTVLGAGVYAEWVEGELARMRAGTVVEGTVALRYRGHDVRATLRLTCAEAAAPAEEAQEEAMAAVPGSFGLSVGEQRLRLATDLVRAWAPASIVDLGCGDGKAISRIVASLAQPPRAVVGVDLSTRALRRGGKAIAKALAPPAPDAEAAARRRRRRRRRRRLSSRCTKGPSRGWWACVRRQ